MPKTFFPFSLSRIIASGASGAKGRQNKNPGRGDEVRALVKLEANETIFIAVGQMGFSYCENNGVSDDWDIWLTNDMPLTRICST